MFKFSIFTIFNFHSFFLQFSIFFDIHFENLCAFGSYCLQNITTILVVGGHVQMHFFDSLHCLCEAVRGHITAVADLPATAVAKTTRDCCKFTTRDCGKLREGRDIGCRSVLPRLR